MFKAFRDACLEHYKLDPAHTSPGLAWKACLKKTGVKLELLTDPDMPFIDMLRQIMFTWVRSLIQKKRASHNT